MPSPTPILSLVLLACVCACGPAGSEPAGVAERARLRDEGMRLLENGRFDEAIEHFDRALAAHPSEQEILRAKSRALEGLGREVESISTRARAEAVWLAARTVEMNPQDAAAWFNLGVMFTGGGNSEPALRCFRRAVELEPQNAEYLFHYAWYLGVEGELEESLRVFDRAIELNPEEPRYHDQLGRILGDAGRVDDAMRAFDRAAELSPDATPSLNRALILVRRERFDEAAPLLEAITDVTPSSRGAQRELGWCLHHMGRFDEALSRYHQAASLSAYGKPIEPWSMAPSNRLWLYRGKTYAAVGRLEEALADLSRFAEARSDYPGVAQAIDEIKTRLGRGQVDRC